MNDVPSLPLCRLFRAVMQRPEQRASSSVFALKSLLLVVLFVPEPAVGEIFECVANKAMPTYQNFPCEFDSLGAMPAAAAATTRSVSAATGVPAARSTARNAASPHVGMTTAEVKAIWGEPIDMTREEYAKGNIETWTYADSRSIQFDLKGRATEIKW